METLTIIVTVFLILWYQMRLDKIKAAAEQVLTNCKKDLELILEP